ncbi:5-amino-6-uracil reductase-like protein [Zopfia rhizophila CBS 207.26]|uniref:2,5-diamino-6-ribosylamino-4(3H)-pyrimidinone 5'-phosphate reductase n=1 Tax=Zopfia rhizophila CBS 207.26 TaxID=1314779 RepID=A0A6A6D4N7_9PEZI|nr:5-amino-6-uracil reductase-like protein [Zopfia rhizophila CBS 207.26]KAF2193501.1 5-amino-6-uracil reductase-like protein [Zopfia rhizophila CBS 207.26]
MDSNIAIAPGVQSPISGPESKAMTHFLRSKHDAIMIGVGTATADNPSLNCRLEGVGGYGGEGLEGQPRPIIIDPQGRWDFNWTSKVIVLAKEGRGKGPFIITLQEPPEWKKKPLEAVGGKYIVCMRGWRDQSKPEPNTHLQWMDMFSALREEGIKSIMIEGGGSVINELLNQRNFGSVNSVIVTVAPMWMGKGGVQVCPEARRENAEKVPMARLRDVKWVPLGEDVVLCGRPKLH